MRKINIFTSLQAYASNIKAFYEYGEIPDIMVNSFQVEQAILNVINNSMEAMNSGGQLTIKTKSEYHSDTAFVVIEISDTGTGISKSRFDGKRLLSEKSGRGFGLFLCREIVQNHGGTLEINSVKNAGTTVRLCFPVRNSHRD